MIGCFMKKEVFFVIRNS